MTVVGYSILILGLKPCISMCYTLKRLFQFLNLKTDLTTLLKKSVSGGGMVVPP